MAGGIFPGLFNIADPQAQYLQGQRDTTQYNQQQEQYNLAKQLQQKQLEDQKYEGLRKAESEIGFSSWSPESKQFFVRSLFQKHGKDVPSYEDTMRHFGELGKSASGAMLPAVGGAIPGSPALPARPGPETPPWTPDITSSSKAEEIEANKEKSAAMQAYYKIDTQNTAQDNIDARVDAINATLAKHGIVLPPLKAAAGVMGTQKIKESDSKINLNLAKIGLTEEQIKYIPLKLKQMADHYQKQYEQIDRRLDISEEQKNIERGRLSETMKQDAFNRAHKGELTWQGYVGLLKLKVPKIDINGRVHYLQKDPERIVDSAIAGFEQKQSEGGGKTGGGAKGHPHIDSAKKDPKGRQLYSKARAKGLTDDQIEALLAKP